MTRQLDDLYFLTFNHNGKLDWQGQVMGQVEPQWYLCQLFSWMMGEPTNMILATLRDMGGWRFYETADEWRQAAKVFDKP